MSYQKAILPLRFAQLIIDIIFINISFLIIFLIRFKGTIPSENYSDYINTIPWISLVAALIFYFYGLYQSCKRSWADVYSSLISAIFILTLASISLSFIFRSFAFPRSVLLLVPLIQLILFIPWRWLAWHLERKFYGIRQALVVGPIEEASILTDKLNWSTSDIVQVIGLLVEPDRKNNVTESKDNILVESDNLAGKTAKTDYPILGDYHNFETCLKEVNPDQVYLCSSLDQEKKPLFLHLSLYYGKQVYLVPNLYETLLGQAGLEQVDDTLVFVIGNLVFSEGARSVKRLIDVLIASVALLVASPLLFLIALLIRLDSPGPVFYQQERLTEQGRSFYLYKFRSMIINAESSTGPVLANKGDPRITRIGKVLRATHLDELPQLINVLKGDMSIVGPRPERPAFVNQFLSETPEYAYRLNIKSGITGLAQIEGKYSTNHQDKLKYDLIYARSYSPIKDLAILLHTIKLFWQRDKAS